MHGRAMSSTSVSSGSVKSFGMGPLRENLREYEGEDYFDHKKIKRLSRDSGVGSSSSKSSNSVGSPKGGSLPEVLMSPSSVSFGLAQRGKARPIAKKSASVRGRPAGDWI